MSEDIRKEDIMGGDASPKIKVHLLGNPYAEQEGLRISFPYRKAEGLFYYLCVRKSAAREELAEIFWGDESETASRKSLREALYQLKKLLGEDLFQMQGHTSVSLNPERLLPTDLEALENGVLESEETEFLEHFHIRGSYEFDQWVSRMQEVCERQVLKVARQEMYQADAARDLEGIRRHAGILMKKEPYSEKLHYEIMDILAVHGQYHQAAQVYHGLERVLREDLDVKPCREISRLYQRICRMKEHVTLKTPMQAEGFFGRTEELYQVSEFLAGRSEAKVLAIGGDPGVGKSLMLQKAGEIAEGYRMLSVFHGCYPEDTGEKFGPWKEILRKLEEKGCKTGQEPFTEEGILHFFRKITREQTAALFLDDVSFMDPESFRLLNRILRTAAPGGLFICMTFRREFESELLEWMDSAVRQDYLEMLWLDCLGEKEALEMLRGLLKDTPGAEETPELLYELTEGNPFFMTEAIRQVQKEGMPLKMSLKMEQALKNSLAGLSPRELRVLEALAYLPEPCGFEELGRTSVLELLELAEILEKLSVHGLVQEEIRDGRVCYVFTRRILRAYFCQKLTEGKKQAFLLTNF